MCAADDYKPMILMWMDEVTLAQFKAASIMSSIAAEYGDVYMSTDVMETVISNLDAQAVLVSCCRSHTPACCLSDALHSQAIIAQAC